MKIAIAKLLPSLIVGAVASASASAPDSSSCLSQTGFDFKEYSTFHVNDDGEYELFVSWKHNEEMSNNATCPGDAPIGCYVEFDDEAIVATGIYGVSIDFTCGHPGNGFLQMHYDAHFYRYPVDVRKSWTCDTGDSPVCIPESDTYTQPDLSGQEYFDIKRVLGEGGEGDDQQPANMPAKFSCGPTSAVPMQGIHCQDLAVAPTDPAEWKIPIFIEGSYGGDIAFVEPMAPLGFVTGLEGFPRTYTEDLVYEGQTIINLPSQYSWTTNEADGRTAIVLKGKAATGVVTTTDVDVDESSSVEEISSFFVYWHAFFGAFVGFLFI